MPIIRSSDCITLPMVFCPVKGNPYEVLCYGGCSSIVSSLFVYMCSVSSLWRSELVIGTVWGGGIVVPGMGRFGGCVVVGMGVFRGAGALIKWEQGSVL